MHIDEAPALASKMVQLLADLALKHGLLHIDMITKASNFLALQGFSIFKLTTKSIHS
jgi:hypothetical protein